MPQAIGATGTLAALRGYVQGEDRDSGLPTTRDLAGGRESGEGAGRLRRIGEGDGQDDGDAGRLGKLGEAEESRGEERAGRLRKMGEEASGQEGGITRIGERPGDVERQRGVGRLIDKMA